MLIRKNLFQPEPKPADEILHRDGSNQKGRDKRSRVQPTFGTRIPFKTLQQFVGFYLPGLWLKAAAQALRAN